MAVFFAAAFGRIFPHAVRAVGTGVGVTAARDALRAGGLRFSNAAYSQAHAVAQRIATVRNLERTAVLTSRPGAARIVRGPWGGSDRFGQMIAAQMRDVATGSMQTWNVLVSGDRLLTRQAAIDIAVESLANTEERYGVRLESAGYDHTRGRL